MSNNIYNYQDFLKEYLLSVDVLNQPQNWKFISNVIKNHSSINKHITDYEKVEMLISETSNETRYNIIDKFGKKSMNVFLTILRIAIVRKTHSKQLSFFRNELCK